MKELRRFMCTVLAVCMVLCCGGVVPHADAAAVTTLQYYPLYVASQGDGTVAGGMSPFAIYVTFSGLTANSTTIHLKGYVPTTSSNYAYNWAGANGWLATGGAWTSYINFTSDGTGNGSGWAYVMLPAAHAGSTTLVAAARDSGGNHYSSSPAITALDMTPATGTGGWIAGTAYLADTVTPAQSKIVVVRNASSAIVGTYSTEDNGITEGCASTAGTYKVAVPVGTGYSVEIWEPATNAIIGSATTGVAVAAGTVTENVTVNGVLAPSAPGVPSAVTATDGLKQIALTWTAPSSEGGAPVDGYNIYRGTSAATLGSTPLNGGTLITGTSYIDADLADGAHWYYAVAAHNAVGEGTKSGAVEGWTFDVPTPVTTLAATAGDGKVELTWDASTADPQGLSVVKYNVWRGTASGGEDTVNPLNGVTPIADTAFTDSTAVNGTTYYYTVTAVNEVGETLLAAGNEVSATPQVSVTAPVVTGLLPADGSFTDVVRPLIAADYSDAGAPIDVSSVLLLVDGVDVTAHATVTASGIRYEPATDLSKSVHTVQLSVANTAATPQTTTVSWSFTIGDFNIYFGGLHSHTNLSDGQGTPQEAYDTGKAAGVDFMAVTDHSNWFDGDSATVAANLGSGPSTEWASLKSIADANNVPGDFVAIAGFEMTWSGGPGHINTFNTVGYDTRTHKSMDLASYYAQLAQYPASISQLNHPGTTFGTFDDFGHWTAGADAVVDLVEVGNGEGVVHQSGYFPSYQYYQMALDKGWHVAPSNNQDNHKGNWMYANDARTVVLAPELTRDAIYEAIRQRRVYATEDKDLQVTYHVNGAVMGSRLDNPATLHFTVSWHDVEVTDTVAKVSIIANGGVTVDATTPGTNAGSWDFTLPSDPYTFYYVRIDQTDSDVAVTAPVWTGDVVKVGLAKVEVSQDPQIVGTPVDITATAYNNGATAVNDATVDFYRDSVAPENRLGQVTGLSIGASASTTAAITWTPTEEGTWTIYAVLSAVVDGQAKTFMASTSLMAADPQNVTQIVIDGGHANAYVTGDYAGNMKTLTALIKQKKWMPVITPVDHQLTAADLQYARVLILNDPQSKPAAKNYSPAEIQVIKDFVAAGGSVILTSRADYNEKGLTDPTVHSAYQGNVILEALGSNLRLNDDEVIDDTSNGGQNYRLYFDQYTGSKYHLTDGIPAGQLYSFYSGCSVVLRNGGSDAAVDWLVKGHATTASFDSDVAHDATPVAMGNVYALAAEVLPGGSKLAVAGTAFFSDFETASADNAYSNLQVISNILDWAAALPPAPLMTVAEARADMDGNGVPDLMGQRVAIEGRVTAQSKAVGQNTAFFDVIYVQDATGGLTVFGISDSVIPLGTLVRVTGVVGQYEDDSQIHVINEGTDVTVTDSTPVPVAPLPMSTRDSMAEASEGWLVQVQGVVTSIVTTGGDNSLYLDDGTGVAKVYVNGYVGDGTDNPAMLGAWDPAIQVGDWVNAVGLASQDAAGHRIRVRNTGEIVRSDGVPVSVIARPLPAGAVDLAYAASIGATGGTGEYVFSLAGGILPEGLHLGSDGMISGVPVAAGSCTFAVKATDGQTYNTKEFAIEVYGSHLAITTPSPLPTGAVDTPYYQVLSAVGGDGTNYAWSLNGGTLPPGLSLHLLTPEVTATTAALQGTPTTAGTYSFTLKVVSAGQAVFKDFTMEIVPATCTVTFDSQGGSAVAAQTVPYNSLLTRPEDPTKSDYVFGGWYREASCTTSWNFTTDKVTTNLTLYAKWTAAVPPVTPGDVDGDGHVTMLDTLMAARAAVGIAPLTGSAFTAADVNGDGTINMLDVLLIARMAVGVPLPD